MSAQPTKLYRLRELAIEQAFASLRGTPATDKEGNLILIDGKPFMLPPTAAQLNTVRQFLKDNGVCSEPMEPAPEGQRSLTSRIPENEDEPTLLE